ncbi:MAG: DUF1949 domain-containing protein [Gemmiger sp.]
MMTAKAKTAGTPCWKPSAMRGFRCDCGGYAVLWRVRRLAAGAGLHRGGIRSLQQAEIVSMRLVTDCAVTVPYPKFEQAQRMIAAAGAKLQEPEYADVVTLRWRMPAGTEEACAMTRAS